jgi:uncharacterized protein YjiS (DUF1127 family)
MFAVHQDEAGKSSERIARYLGDAFLKQLVFRRLRLNPWRLFRRLRDEARRNATIRELNMLSDHYLDDVAVRRRIDLRADDLVKRLRAGG